MKSKGFNQTRRFLFGRTPSLTVLLAVLMCGPLALTGKFCLAQRADVNYDESLVPTYELPDPLIDLAGRPVTNQADWQLHRRQEVVRLFEDHVYGRTPQQALGLAMQSRVIEEDAQALDGRATRKQIEIALPSLPSLKLNLLVYIPNGINEPASCFLGLNFYGNQTVHHDEDILINSGWMRSNDKLGIVNNRATEKSRGANAHRWQVEKVIDAGFAVATCYYGDIDPDNYQHDFADGVHRHFYVGDQSRPDANEWGAIGAWAWGLSRLLDVLRCEPCVAGDRVVVIGHSRLGKTALWAGARDERFAMIVSNNSGCGGAALYRRNFGERIQHMAKSIGYWFCRDHLEFAGRENELPVDQHMLIALMAPRPVYVASASADRWADPKGEFLAAKEAESVYRLFGMQGIGGNDMPGTNQPIGDRVGYHVREGKHDVTAYDWDQYISFAKRHLN